jgi:hypothetical protein
MTERIAPTGDDLGVSQVRKDFSDRPLGWFGAPFQLFWSQALNGFLQPGGCRALHFDSILTFYVTENASDVLFCCFWHG